MEGKLQCISHSLEKIWGNLLKKINSLIRTLFIVFEEKYMEFVQGPGELSVMWRCPFDLAEGYY